MFSHFFFFFMFHFSYHGLALSTIQSHPLPFIYFFSLFLHLSPTQAPSHRPSLLPFIFFSFFLHSSLTPTPYPDDNPSLPPLTADPSPKLSPTHLFLHLLFLLVVVNQTMGWVDVDRVVVMGCCSVGHVIDRWSGLCGWVDGSLCVCGWLGVSLGEGFGSLGYDVVVVNL